MSGGAGRRGSARGGRSAPHHKRWWQQAKLSVWRRPAPPPATRTHTPEAGCGPGAPHHKRGRAQRVPQLEPPHIHRAQHIVLAAREQQAPSHPRGHACDLLGVQVGHLMHLCVVGWVGVWVSVGERGWVGERDGRRRHAHDPIAPTVRRARTHPLACHTPMRSPACGSAGPRSAALRQSGLMPPGPSRSAPPSCRWRGRERCAGSTPCPAPTPASAGRRWAGACARWRWVGPGQPARGGQQRHALLRAPQRWQADAGPCPPLPHTLIVRSAAQLTARCESVGLQATPVALPLWPVRERRRRPLATSHTRMACLFSAPNTSLPSGVKATPFTPSNAPCRAGGPEGAGVGRGGVGGERSAARHRRASERLGSGEQRSTPEPRTRLACSAAVWV